MFRNLKKISPGGAIILMLVLISAAILKYSLQGEINLYWLLFVTVPLLIVAVIYQLQVKPAALGNYQLDAYSRNQIASFRQEHTRNFFVPDVKENLFLRRLHSFVDRRPEKERSSVATRVHKDHNKADDKWLAHSMFPHCNETAELRVTIGNDQCLQPYSASILNIGTMRSDISGDAVIDILTGVACDCNFAFHIGESTLGTAPFSGNDIVWQIGSGYLGCRDSDGRFSMEKFRTVSQRPDVKMIELKFRTGHTAFSSAEGMLLFLESLREGSSGKPVGFCCGVTDKKEFREICYCMHKTGIVPDFITIEGMEEVDGAIPPGSAEQGGMPLFEALSFASKSLEHYQLKPRVKIFAAGEIYTGFDILKTLALGADACFTRGDALSLDFRKDIVSQKSLFLCRFDTKDLKFSVTSFHRNTLQVTKNLMKACGFRKPDEISISGFLRKIRISDAVSDEQVNTSLTQERNCLTIK